MPLQATPTSPTRSPESWAKISGLLRRQPRRQRHAFGAAGVQHPAPHLRPAGLRRREVLPLRFELCGRAASVRHRGPFENRKGQDIFCKAIRLLPPETMKKASFLFVGKAAEAEMMDAVRSLTADCPDNVFYVKRLTRDEIKSLMAQCTCLVCASRDDPMPTFVTEGPHLRQARHRVGAHRHRRAHHRGRGRFSSTRTTTPKAGRAAGLGHRAPGKAGCHAPRLP